MPSLWNRSYFLSCGRVVGIWKADGGMELGDQEMCCKKYLWTVKRRPSLQGGRATYCSASLTPWRRAGRTDGSGRKSLWESLVGWWQLLSRDGPWSVLQCAQLQHHAGHRHWPVASWRGHDFVWTQWQISGWGSGSQDILCSRCT